MTEMAKIGSHSFPTGEIIFEEVQIPAANILGSPEDGARILFGSLPDTRLGAAARGLGLAMGCDFVLAHAQAQFGCLEMKQGFPAAINIALLSHHLGRRKALEIAMTGELMTARELRSFGLANLLGGKN